MFIFVLSQRVNKSVISTSCKQHTWKYKDIGDGNEYMQCDVCKKLPGIEDKGSLL